MAGFDLPDLPETFQDTRDHLHQIAFYALGPVRHKSEGRMGLIHHEGGFGTPEFDGKALHVEGDRLVVTDDQGSQAHTFTTLREAVEFLGHEYEDEWFPDFHDPLDPLHPDESLDIDPESTRVLGQWFAYAWVLLNELRTHGTEEDEASEVQLWPEHFDAAIEMGSHEAGARASYGASPGDEAHPEPYLYVSAWGEIDRTNPYWNDRSFNGSSLSYEALRLANDPVATGLDFLLEGYRILRTDT
ncbi:MAG: hypothetical protein R3258_01210 [Acidimicrobiia bacterium]|nr:hypothetical protein [Acidimicrobiia bacterium]